MNQSSPTPAILHHVDPILNATMAFVIAYQNTKVIRTEAVDPSVF